MGNAFDSIETDYDVYQYEGFIAALNGYLELRRRTHPTTWSMGAWSKRLNLANTASLSNILSERKSISRELGMNIIGSMRLEKKASEYLELLLELLFCTASHPVVIMGIRSRMKQLKEASLNPHKEDQVLKIRKVDLPLVKAAAEEFRRNLHATYDASAAESEDVYMVDVLINQILDNSVVAR